MEAVRLYTRHVMPSLKPVNVNYFLSVIEHVRKRLIRA